MLISRTRVLVNQKIKRRRMRELGCTPKAAIAWIEHAQNRFRDSVDHTRRKLATGAGKGFRVGESALDHFCLFYNLAMFFTVCIGDSYQHPFEAGAAILIARREVSAAKKWLAIGCKEGGERPS